MTYHRLSSIASIVTGYSFRSAIVPDNNGNYLVIQAKDVGEGSVFSKDNLTRISADKLPENTIVKSGDVVLSSRGKYKAAVVNLSVPTIASSSVFILRVNNKIVNSEYLAIYLNSALGQSQLGKLTSGNYIKSIPKFSLENLIVDVPTIEKQTKVSLLYKNIAKQRELLNKKISIMSSISESSLLYVLNLKN